MLETLLLESMSDYTRISKHDLIIQYLAGLHYFEHESMVIGCFTYLFDNQLYLF